MSKVASCKYLFLKIRVETDNFKYVNVMFLISST